MSVIPRTTILYSVRLVLISFFTLLVIVCLLYTFDST